MRGKPEIERLDVVYEYPELIYSRVRCSLVTRGVETGAGWHNLLRRLLAALSRLQMRNRQKIDIAMIRKDPSGRLVVGLCDRRDGPGILTDAAQEVSLVTCETCGDPGELREMREPTVLCEDCFENARHPYWPGKFEKDSNDE